MHHRITVSLAFVMSLACALFTGCGEAQPESDASSSESPVAAAAPVDERFASPEALLTYAKSILDSPEPNMHDFYQLFQWESPAQQTWFSYVQFFSVPYGNLKREFTRRFPSEKWPVKVPLQFYEMHIPDVKITTRDEERAQGNFRERNGPPQTLHMVRKYGRWWISGYTLEYAGNMESLNKMAADSGQSRDVLLLAASREHQGVIDLAARLKTGNIKTMSEFAKAAEELFGSP